MSKIDEMIIESGADAGELIGHRANGEPIFAVGGGVRNSVDAWLPEEFGSAVITRVKQTSAVEAYASKIPMKTATRSTPRSAGVGVDFTAKGTAYGEDTSLNDQVVLQAQKFTKAIRVADEDLDDTLANVIATKQLDWATSYGKIIDQATLACSGLAVSATVPFISVYALLSNADATLGYTAGANITKTTALTAATYDDLNNTLGLVEVGDYFDESRMMAIAHPSFRKALRGIKDTTNEPIFRDVTNSDIGVNGTLFGAPLRWSLGCRTNATPTSSPTGNPLIVFANMDYLLLGVRSGPESAFADADSGVGFLTDEAILKMRSRRGFAGGHPNAFSILEQR